ncbi:MAG: PilX N-terminal domain-containing pilus assembly protein [Syntrophobacteraceae bacterium]
MMNTLRNERGSALIITLLMIALLSVIGIFSAQTSKVENKLAGNDRLHKVAFHGAEGGIQVAKELVEANIEDRGGWTANTSRQGVFVREGTIFSKESLKATEYASETDCQAYFPASWAAGEPRTNIRVGGNQSLSTGSAIMMVAGYEGKGKSAAQGGAYIIYDIRSEHHDGDNSMARILSRYRHVM